MPDYAGGLPDGPGRAKRGRLQLRISADANPARIGLIFEFGYGRLSIGCAARQRVAAA